MVIYYEFCVVLNLCEVLYSLFDMTDWYATLLAMAGGSVSGIDGVDQWNSINTKGATCVSKKINTRT